MGYHTGVSYLTLEIGCQIRSDKLLEYYIPGRICPWIVLLLGIPVLERLFEQYQYATLSLGVLCLSIELMGHADSATFLIKV